MDDPAMQMEQEQVDQEVFDEVVENPVEEVVL